MSQYAKLLAALADILFDLGVRSRSVRSFAGPYLSEDDLIRLAAFMIQRERREGNR